MAERLGIEVWVVAESMKLAALPSEDDQTRMPVEESEQLFSGVDSPLHHFRAQGLVPEVLNLGYDLCPMPANVVLISEDPEL
jgi:hypothetical protein